ncbi:nucleotide exchange factor GrpE [Cryomorphaceae bacterium 1068]|nr:nucleotide exchange factor GrpE [Cryomorphaceae bacterium 1068]
MSEKDKVESQDIEETQAQGEEQAFAKADKSNSSNGNSNSSEESTENEYEAAMTELQKKYDTVNDKYLRLYSEFENFRRRTAKEKLDLMKNAGSDFAGDILPVVDDFERAISSNENNDDVEALKEGFKLIHHKLLNLLQNKGLKAMNSINQPFDTEYHEAITNIPAPSEDMKGKVIDVAEKGYFYNDKVLRYAKVVVGQ